MLSFFLKDFLQEIFWDEPLDVIPLAWSVQNVFDIKNKEISRIKTKTLKAIKFMLDTKLVCVGEFINPNHFQIWNLSPEESYKKIRTIWNETKTEDYANVVEQFWLALTPEGFKFVKKNLKNQKVFAQKIISAGYKKDLTLREDLIKYAKEAFNTDNMREIRDEIALWVKKGFQEIGFKVFLNQFFVNYKKWSSFKNMSRSEFILVNWDKLIDSSLHNWQLWFRNTSEANELVEKWQKEGGVFFTDTLYQCIDSNLDEIEVEQRKRYKY